MRSARPRTGFSLLEVVFATAVFAIGILASLGLLATGVRQSRNAADRETALRLADRIELEARLWIAPESFADFSSLRLVAARDGGGITLQTDVATGASAYFLVEITAFTDGPFRYSPDSPSLIAWARISWPYQPGQPAPPDSVLGMVITVPS